LQNSFVILNGIVEIVVVCTYELCVKFFEIWTKNHASRDLKPVQLCT